MSQDLWFIQDCPWPPANLRMICLPFAGGGASIFRTWAKSLPKGLEVCRVQLPGRENRINETALEDMDVLVDQLLKRIPPLIVDTPLVILGHSMGGLIAYELAARMEHELGLALALLIIAGVRPPHLKRYDPISHLPRDMFIQGLRKRKGTPEAVLQSEELMELLLPMVRADFTLAENYSPPRRPPLSTPILALCGKQDQEVSPSQMFEWQGYTNHDFRVRLFEGGHFFIRDQKEPVQREVFHHLKSLLKPLPKYKAS